MHCHPFINHQIKKAREFYPQRHFPHPIICPKKCATSASYNPTHIILKPTPLQQPHTTANTSDHSPPRRTISPTLLQPPPSSPYLACKTRYHNPSLSTNIRQHHFPNKDTLNPSTFSRLDHPPPSVNKQSSSLPMRFSYSPHHPPQKKKFK